jgi:hypothetical protein
LNAFEAFAHSNASPIDTPVLDSITDRDNKTGAFTIIAYANVAANSKWHWQLKLTTPSGGEFRTGEEPASLLFQSFDPRTGEARIRVVPQQVPFEGPLTISFDDTQTSRSTLPASFPAPAPGIDLEKFIEKVETMRGSSARVAIDGSAASVLALALSGIVMLSPVARRWTAFWEIVDAQRRKWNAGTPLPARTAPLFSVEASLTEWGTHPGRPAAAPNAGLPAGMRSWRSGDSGRAIMPATLYSLVGESPALPPTRPHVRLKTSSEAAGVLILIEGTGALLSPVARNAPSKAVFAARLAAFLAGAVSLAYGRAEVARVGIRDQLSNDPLELYGPILDMISAKPSFTPPLEHFQSGITATSIVFFICDGLSLNVEELIAISDTLNVDGTQLRIAAVTSEDDRNGAMMRRDPRSGDFSDDSETHPITFITKRDLRLRAAQTELDRRGTQLQIFDTQFSTQEVLQQIADSGFVS